MASIVALLSKIRRSRGYTTDSSTTDTDTAIESSSEELLSAYQDSQQGGFAAYDELAKKVAALEERFRSLQELLADDSAYSSDVTDLASWLGQMETKIAGHIAEPTEEEVDSGKDESIKTEKTEEKKELPPKRVETKEKVVEERLGEEHDIKEEIDEILGGISAVNSQMMLSAPELQATNDRLKKLAHNLNDQLHGLRDKVFLLDHELKRMAKGVEFALMRAKFAGANEMVSVYILFCYIFFDFIYYSFLYFIIATTRF